MTTEEIVAGMMNVAFGIHKNMVIVCKNEDEAQKLLRKLQETRKRVSHIITVWDEADEVQQ
jgi:hypothetical protein